MSSRAPIGHLGITRTALCTNQGCKTFVPHDDVNAEFLYHALGIAMGEIQELGSGATFKEVSKSKLASFSIPLPQLSEQKRIASILNEQMAAVEKARKAAEERLEAANALRTVYLRESLAVGSTKTMRLGCCLEEVKRGVGEEWHRYPVYGATKTGLAMAKDPVGKTPIRYKLVDVGTVFYNPMRIMIGSIAVVDKGTPTGITSPDYVAVKPIPGIVHWRWFYHWMRSPYGRHMIQATSRGAVRERILFNRLKKAEIRVPSWSVQELTAEKLFLLDQLYVKLQEMENSFQPIPASLLRKAFSGEL